MAREGGGRSLHASPGTRPHRHAPLAHARTPRAGRHEVPVPRSLARESERDDASRRRLIESNHFRSFRFNTHTSNCDFAGWDYRRGGGRLNLRGGFLPPCEDSSPAPREKPPAGAGLVLLPMIMSFQVGDHFFRSPWVVSGFLFCIGTMLVSPIPTYSFKKVTIPRQHFLVTMLIVALVIALFASMPWLCLTAIIMIYLGAIPLSIRSQRRYESGEEVDEVLDEDLEET